jgi:bifunctional DNase/RNase
MIPFRARHALLRLVLPGGMVLPILLAAAAAGAGSPPEPVPVHLAGIRSVGPDQVLLLLADEREGRAVPIAVGRDQGIAIYLGKERARAPRPMTHDLLVQILTTLGAVVDRVTITEIKNDTYYAEIALRSGTASHRIDARPSDAIALALRLGAPMFAAADLLRPVEDGERPGILARAGRRLGLSVQKIDRDLAEFLGARGVPGLLVASVAPDGLAEGAGLRRGDILKEIDGRPTADLEAFKAASERASEAPRFVVWRDGREVSLAGP